MKDSPLQQLFDEVPASSAEVADAGTEPNRIVIDSGGYEPTEAGAEPYDGFEDIELEDPRPPRRLSLLTTGLLACLLAVSAFGLGAVVYKHANPSAGDTAAAGGLRNRAAAFAAEGGALGGFGGGAAGAGAAAGAGTGTAGAATTGAAATPPIAAVGTVVSITKSTTGSTMTLKNLGGKTVVVTIPLGTDITTQTTASGVTSLATGATVSVAGTTAADGKVTASTVTVRAP